MPQTCSHGQDKPVEPPVATSQPTKRKRGPKKKKTAEELEAEKEADLAVKKRLADLEVARSCDNDLPTPRPVSDSQRSTTLSQMSSRVDISALIAQQKCASKEVAGGSAADDSATENEVPIKRLRRVVVPDPVTPVAAKVRRPTAVQKQDAARAKEAAKEAERLAREDAKAKKAADRQAKAQAKEDERERKAEERREKAREKARAKEAKDLEKKAKKAAMDGPPSTLTGTKADAVRKDDNTGEPKEGTKGRKDMEKQATGGKKKEKGKASRNIKYFSIWVNTVQKCRRYSMVVSTQTGLDLRTRNLWQDDP
ncbi:hypothetical protein V8E52_004473 [Russula decolorans]